MPLNWKGKKLKRKLTRAQIEAVNTTMSAAILDAKSDHQGGGPTGVRTRSDDRFQTQTGKLERSIRIDKPAAPIRKGVLGRWGSLGVKYARRIELGFQGKDSLGRVFDQQAFPFLRPAADREYPKLAARIRNALRALR